MEWGMNVIARKRLEQIKSWNSFRLQPNEVSQLTACLDEIFSLAGEQLEDHSTVPARIHTKCAACALARAILPDWSSDGMG